MPLSLLNHSALALFVQRTRIPTSARSIGFCAIWVCISSSSSSRNELIEVFKDAYPMSFMIYTVHSIKAVHACVNPELRGQQLKIKAMQRAVKSIE